MSNSGRGPFLGMVMGGPSGRQEMQQRLVMTPRVRRRVDGDAIRSQTLLPSSSITSPESATADESDIAEE